MIEILALILPLFGLIFLGFVGAKAAGHPIEAMAWLNTFIVYFALPALFFRLLSQTPVEELTNWRFIVITTSVTAGVLLLTFCLGLIESRGRLGEATVQGLAGAYGNIGYMGPAVAILALGEPAAIPVALIFCFENVMMFVFAPAMMAMTGGSGRSGAAIVLDVVRRVALHPFILATIVGVGAAAIRFTPPEPVGRLIDYLAQAAAPCALFAMGATLGLRPLRRVPRALGYIAPIKLVAHPLATFVALSYVGGFDPIWVATAVLLAALPTATNVFVIAQQYGFWVERASASVLITTTLSAVSLTLLLFAVSADLLPRDPFGRLPPAPPATIDAPPPSEGRAPAPGEGGTGG